MDLAELQEIAEKELESRKPHRFRVCMAAGCLSSGAAGVKQALDDAVAAAGVEDRVDVCEVGCMKLCCEGPLVQADPAGTLYEMVTPEQAKTIVGTIDGGKTTATVGNAERPFFTRQRSIVLENSGLIEPERIESYIAAGGYLALRQVLREMTPAEVIEEVITSGLRGRGGAGYPTGLKWGTVAKHPADKKFVVCNADEGDPGAFMDRTVLESDPHRILEGMAIAAYAIGADAGLHLRAGRVSAGDRAASDRHSSRPSAWACSGSQIFESPFNFKIDLRIGAGAFVCGEETALMASIEGQRGVPRPRPPFPAESGLWGFPTLINNVETFANIAADHPQGGEWFAGIGTEKSKGTKVFALAGKIKNTGLIEVPMGTTVARDRRGDGRRRPGRWHRSRPSRPAARPAAAFRPSSSIRRSTTSRWPSSARSWARAA